MLSSVYQNKINQANGFLKGICKVFFYLCFRKTTSNQRIVLDANTHMVSASITEN